MKLEITYLPTSELTPYKNNAKLHPQEQIDQIKNSIKEFGMNDPIAVWGDENIIIEGHGRLLACQQLGMETVPVIRLDDLTEDQRKAYTLAHNKLTMNTDFDLEMLKTELQDIDLDMGEFGFDDIELDDITLETEPEEDEIPEPPKEAKSKLGDIYQLGDHRLMCGDSTKVDDMKKLMGDDVANLYLTDPPYNVAYGQYGSATEARALHRRVDHKTIMNDKMEDEAFRAFLTDAFIAANEVLASGASFYIFYADTEGYNFRGACRDMEWKVRENLIWNKNSLCLGRQDYQWKHEPILYGWKEGTHRWFNDRKQTTVIDFDKPLKSEEHPTMKPVGLVAYLIGNSSKAGEIVLDSFGGSGTTLIACEQLGRKCRTMELDPHYVDVIVERWEKLTGRKAEKVN